jgi:3',5'-cyclic AMP phosphodiesterase CpdA
VENKTSRRDVLAAATAAGAGLLLPTGAMADRKSDRSLRIAYFTDTHIPATGPGADWLAKALQHAQTRNDKPDLIFFGGDMIMDGLAQPWDSVKAQWKQFLAVVRDNAKIPYKRCIGNHDIWGWDKRSGATGTEPLFGKEWVMELMGWQKPYKSYDLADWHFVVLDSMTRKGNGYLARIDDEQFEWLKSDLQANRKKKTVIVSHIPLVASCPMWFGAYESDGANWQVPGWLLHIDARRFKNLFNQNPQVKACLSGHIHLLDRVDYNGVTYLCNGSIAGAWWNGPFHETSPGYAMIDFYTNGRVEREYVPYGWKKS